MALTLQRFASGDTNYVSKHNANADAIETEAASVRSALTSGLGAAVSVGAALEALFGTSAAVVGKDSYKCTGSGSTLTVAAGYAWLSVAAAIVSHATSSTLSFAGQSAATYYITADASGNPVLSTVATDALYSVVWTGSAFGTITRVAQIVFGATDDVAAQVSTALGASYESLDARLEAGETVAQGAADDLATHQAASDPHPQYLTQAEGDARYTAAGGAVTSINGETGVVTLDAADVGAAAASHTHATSDVTGFNEAVDDRVAALIVAGSNISATYDDGANTLTIAATAPGSGAGSGDVVGPSSSINNHVAFFDGTTGKLLKDSGLTLSGTNTGDQTITLTGDVTASGTGSFAATIANDSVTYAKLQNVSAASKLLGRGDSGSGDPQEITLGTGLSMSGTTLNATASGGGGIAPDVQTFTADGTWTKPAGCTLVRVVCIGGGGGGGGGVGGASSTVRAGGTGGGGGARHERIILASELSSTVSVTIGTGGSAGNGGSSGVGTDGTSGSSTTFGAYLAAYGGGKGVAGAAGSGRSGGGGGGTMAAGGNGAMTAAVGGFPQTSSTASASAYGGGGGNTNTTAAAPGASEFGGGGGGGTGSAGTCSNGGGSVYGGGGGGGGGGVGSGNVSVAGGEGGSATQAAAGGGNAGNNTGGAGGNGGTPGTSHYSGQGGGGGGGNASGTGGAGGAGAIPGGGGAGGGGGTTTGGNGGTGARGECRVYAW